MLTRFSLSRHLQDGKSKQRIQGTSSYDTRFRATQRRWEIYENHYLKNEKLVIVPSPDAQDNEAADDSFSKEHRLWRSRSPGELVVFETPFREGRHFAKKPGEFATIQALEKLHEDGFVHGDIRGFNTVFSENEGEGWLIDFDLAAGKYNQQLCSPEATNYLDDGMRCENMRSVKKWHDWYALGQLIFIVTALILLRPELITGNSIDVLKWKKIEETKQATPEMIGAERLLQELGTKIGVRGPPPF
jgi:hypothetical protein